VTPGRRDAERIETTAGTGVLPCPVACGICRRRVVSQSGRVVIAWLAGQAPEGRSYRLGCRTTAAAARGPKVTLTSAHRRGGRPFRGCPVASDRFSEPRQGQLRSCARRSGWKTGGMTGVYCVTVGYLVAAWYCSATLAGMRPRSLTGMPLAFAHARMSPPRSLSRTAASRLRDPHQDHLPVRPRSLLPSRASMTAMGCLHRTDQVLCRGSRKRRQRCYAESPAGSPQAPQSLSSRSLRRPVRSRPLDVRECPMGAVRK
jgi:hypothetical protein